MRICVSAWSLRETTRRGNLSLIDLPGFVHRHGFEGLEFSHRQLAQFQRSDLERLAESCARARIIPIIDLDTNLTYADPALRRQQIVHVNRALGVAHALKSHCVRIWLGGQSLSIQKLFGRRMLRGAPRSFGKEQRSHGFGGVARRLLLNKWALLAAHAYRMRTTSRVRSAEEKMRCAIDALREIVPTAAQWDISLVIENHWGVSARPENILRVVEEINSSRLGACPDLGNFPRDIDPYEALGMLAPKALHAHAKSFSFDKDGEEKRIDYRRALRIFRAHHYDAAFTVEYEGTGDDLEGCVKTRELLLRHW